MTGSGGNIYRSVTGINSAVKVPEVMRKQRKKEQEEGCWNKGNCLYGGEERDKERENTKDRTHTHTDTRRSPQVRRGNKNISGIPIEHPQTAASNQFQVYALNFSVSLPRICLWRSTCVPPPRVTTTVCKYIHICIYMYVCIYVCTCTWMLECVLVKRSRERKWPPGEISCMLAEVIPRAASFEHK